MASLFSYDVFLSFRGEDTRYAFTGNLRKALNDRGISIYIDEKDLQKGNELTPSLMEAIEESRMAIVVLSENYASSSFCLQELTKILECIKEKGRLVLPIFYKVDPSDMRKLKGTYGEAMNLHEKGSNAMKSPEWKKALITVAAFSGFHYKGDTHEHQLIEDIVEKVFEEIEPLTLPVADYLVGLEFPKKHIASLLNIRCRERFHMVGIHGIGGIGKTTLAKAVYNLIAHEFQVSCFLENVRENSEKRGLIYIQKIILSKITGAKNLEFTRDADVILKLSNTLPQKKVLLILDDVDTNEQLDAIVGKGDCFSPGSRVIVTTRNKGLLTYHGVESTYEMEELNKKDAFQLLRLRAFQTKGVNPGYEDVLKRAVTYASGLPLALEVIGSHLFNKTLEQCNSALDRYEMIPNNKIQTILKLSYDALEEEEKKIFLDIACCFKGYQLEMVEKILHAHHGYSMKDPISVLVEKSLIKIQWGDVILHDLIEDMGKEIDRQNSPKNPGERSRLWCPKDIIEVLEENTGTKEVEIIHLDFKFASQLMVNWDGQAFKKMENLRTLIIKGGIFSEDFKYLPNSLRVLELVQIPQWRLPPHFYPKKLAICILSDDLLSSDWVNIFTKRFTDMKALYFHNNSVLRRIPDISGLLNLEEFSVQNCKNLIVIDESIGLLGKLKILRISNCPRLMRIPRLNLGSLEKLNLELCHHLESFPFVEEGLMNKLKILSVIMCNKLRSFPPLMLASLEELYLQHCKSLENLPAMTDGSLGELKILSFMGCINLKSIGPLSLPSLELLDLSFCRSLESFLPVVSGSMEKLKSLKLIDCHKLKTIPPLKLALLEELNIEGCDNLESFPPMVDGLLDTLKILRVKRCKKLSSIPPLKLASLEELSVEFCVNLGSFPPMVDGLWDKLKILRVIECKMLSNIPPLKLTSLEILRLEHCESLENLPAVMDGSFGKLKILSFKGCKTLKSIAALSLPLLEELDLSFCESLESFLPVVGRSMEKLKILKLIDCKKLETIPPLKLSSLEELYAEGCDNLESFPPLVDGSLDKLKILNVTNCTCLNNIPPLKLASLETLKVQDVGLESLSPMMDGTMDKLNFLLVGYCKKLSSIPPLKLASLKELHLEFCVSLQSFPAMVDGSLGKLKILSFVGCESLTSIGPLSLPFLEKLDLSLCRSLESVSLVVEKLQIFKAKSCSKLTNISSINFAFLQELDLSECGSLKSLPLVLDGLLEKFNIFSIEGCLKFKSIQPAMLLELLKEFELSRFGRFASDCGLSHDSKKGIVVVSKAANSTIQDTRQQFPKQEKDKEKVNPLQYAQVELLCTPKHSLSNESLAISLKLFSNMKELYLSENDFTILPKCIENFHRLWKLVLDNCKKLEEIEGIPPSLRSLSAYNCNVLTKSSKSKLLKQELHEAGNTWFCVPRAWTPDWFDYRSKENTSITFWFRNKFPCIVICVVSPLIWDVPRCKATVTINGYEFFYWVERYKRTSREAGYHLTIFHMQIEKFSDNLDKALLENMWNHAKVNFGFAFQESGIHVLKEKSSMEDIRFTNPENDIITELVGESTEA